MAKNLIYFLAGVGVGAAGSAVHFSFFYNNKPRSNQNSFDQAKEKLLKSRIDANRKELAQIKAIHYYNEKFNAKKSRIEYGFTDDLVEFDKNPKNYKTSEDKKDNEKTQNQQEKEKPNQKKVENETKKQEKDKKITKSELPKKKED